MEGDPTQQFADNEIPESSFEFPKISYIPKVSVEMNGLKISCRDRDGNLGLFIGIESAANNTLRRENLTRESVELEYLFCASRYAGWLEIPYDDIPVQNIRIFENRKIDNWYDPLTQTIHFNTYYLRWDGGSINVLRRHIVHLIGYAVLCSKVLPEKRRTILNELERRKKLNELTKWANTYDGAVLTELLPLAAEVKFVGLNNNSLEEIEASQNFKPENERGYLMHYLYLTKQSVKYGSRYMKSNVMRRFAAWLVDVHGPEKIAELGTGDNIGRNIDDATHRVLNKSFGEIILEYAEHLTQTHLSRGLTSDECKDIIFWIRHAKIGSINKNVRQTAGTTNSD